MNYLIAGILAALTVLVVTVNAYTLYVHGPDKFRSSYARAY
mgnify:CR=1 FL=1